MEAEKTFIDPLLEKAEQFGKTSFELFKLKAIDKISDITSTLASRLILIIAVSLFVFTLNIAIALWLGDILGKTYYGFLVVAAFYGLLGILLAILHPFIKNRVSNSIIKQMLN